MIPAMLKRIARIVGLLLAVAVGAVAIFVVTYKPAQQPAPAITVDATPDRISRGQYLVEHQLLCFECHTDRDWTRYNGPPLGPPGAGGLCVTAADGFPGHVCARNITPDVATGIGQWTDGEIMRAIREGVDRTGRGLAPIMPYENYRYLADEDTRAVVAYLRTLKPVSHEVPKPKIDFPLSLFMKMLPAPLPGPVAGPDPQDTIARGRYLATTSLCVFCHTPVNERMEPLPGMTLAGGHVHKGPFGVVRASNLTPHPTGLGDRTREEFIGIFRAFRGFAATSPPADPTKNTVMPWIALADLTDEDLGAIYAYLRSVPPVENRIERHPVTAATAEAVQEGQAP